MRGCSYSSRLSSPLVELSWIIVSRINPVPIQRARTVVLRGRGLGAGSIVFGEASAICLEWRRSVEVCGVEIEREKK
jgi:hypothetical protein